MPQESEERQGDVATRGVLVRKALELFAAQGFYGPSLRKIGKEAGQKNTAVVHYHFKDREGLLKACLELVLEGLSEPVGSIEPWLPRPAALMSPLATTVYPFCLPVLLLPDRQEWGRDGVRFLARVMQGESEALTVDLERLTTRDVDAFIEALAPLLPHLSAQLLRVRYDLISVTLVGALVGVAYDEALPATTGRGQSLPSLHLLMDFVLGGLSAPMN